MAALLLACLLPVLAAAASSVTGGASAPKTAAAHHPSVPAGPIGHWEGGIDLFGRELGMRVDIQRAGDSLSATIDIPQQGATQLPLNHVRAAGDSVHFELPSMAGLANFDGVQRGDSILGSFRQSGITTRFRLGRGAPRAVAQEDSVPYRREAVRYANGTVSLAGTLTLPQGRGPFAAVLLITGSGQQDRDETLLGFKPFKLIADRLTRDGIAVLRVDDRGVGGSTGDATHATTQDFAGDVRAGVAYLKGRRDIDARHIGLLGHSEGGLIAPMVAADSKDVAFIVLLAGPGVPGDTLMIEQGVLIARSQGASDSVASSNAQLQRLGFRAARTNQNWEILHAAVLGTLRRTLAAQSAEAVKTGIDVEEFARSRADAQVAIFKSPWLRYFIDYDPAPTLARVTVPVLALFGEQDLQVPAYLNRPPVERALTANPDAKVLTIADANHLFQPTASGNPALYGTLPKEFAPGVLDTLSIWVTAHARVPARAAP